MRTIDADKLMEAVMAQSVVDKSVAKRLIIQAQTVEPQIVRCGECKHSYHTMNGKTKSSMRVVLACSEMDDREVEPDWYCADGVRDINVPSKSDERREKDEVDKL